MRLRTTHAAQALVETALALTLIFFLLVAAVDVGMIFLDLQGLHNAAQEGASYGSRFLVVDSLGVAQLDEDGIRQRVRFVSGDNGGINFVDMLDLNSDGIPDVIDSDGDGILDTPQINPETGRPVIEDYIQIDAVYDANGDGDPTNDGDGIEDNVPGGGDRTTPCPSLADPDNKCYVRVVVHADYKVVFPITVFGKEVPLHSTFYMPIRAGFTQAGAPTMTPDVITNTPTPTPTPTDTPKPSKTPEPTATHTPTRTNTPTRTPTRTPTNTPTRTPTNTLCPVNVCTPTPTRTPTNTPKPTNTPTPKPTNTPTLTPTRTNTPTPKPTNTPTNTPKPTNTPTMTPKPTRSGT